MKKQAKDKGMRREDEEVELRVFGSERRKKLSRENEGNEWEIARPRMYWPLVINFPIN